MAGDLAANVTDNILTCPICLETFDDPRVLPCYHTFCLGCISDHARVEGQRTSFHCPMCRETIDIPKGGLRNLKKNFVFQKVKTIIDESKSRPNTTQKGHCATDDLPPGKRQDADWSLQNCEEHPGNELRYYCQNDDTIVCADCIVTRHRGHNCMPLTEVVGKSRAQIQILQQKALKKLSAIRQIEQNFDANIPLLVQNEEATLEAIDKQAEQLYAIITESREKLKNETRTAFKSERQKSESYKNDLDLQKAILDSTCEFAQQLLTNGSDFDIMMHTKMLKERFGQIEQVQLSNFEDTELVTFVPGNITNSSVAALLGKVAVKESESRNTRQQEKGEIHPEQILPESPKCLPIQARGVYQDTSRQVHVPKLLLASDTPLIKNEVVKNPKGVKRRSDLPKPPYTPGHTTHTLPVRPASPRQVASASRGAQERRRNSKPQNHYTDLAGILSGSLY
ncbi:tripartite motif-containing protein 2 isoform X2 [Lingula anatina]|nr:tripartite motif-containing protein 2 isoform X2 [Lingula anatina]|eukprot:XP_013398854.1 tripartite motif-containing protein 2 isoform X2 [Lingula anatina]